MISLSLFLSLSFSFFLFLSLSHSFSFFLILSFSHLWMQVRFRMVVFRPFVGEVLKGKIKRCTDNGIFGE